MFQRYSDCEMASGKAAIVEGQPEQRQAKAHKTIPEATERDKMPPDVRQGLTSGHLDVAQVTRLAFGIRPAPVGLRKNG